MIGDCPRCGHELTYCTLRGGYCERCDDERPRRRYSRQRGPLVFDEAERFGCPEEATVGRNLELARGILSGEEPIDPGKVEP